MGIEAAQFLSWDYINRNFFASTPAPHHISTFESLSLTMHPVSHSDYQLSATDNTVGQNCSMCPQVLLLRGLYSPALFNFSTNHAASWFLFSFHPLFCCLISICISVLCTLYSNRSSAGALIGISLCRTRLYSVEECFQRTGHEIFLKNLRKSGTYCMSAYGFQNLLVPLNVVPKSPMTSEQTSRRISCERRAAGQWTLEEIESQMEFWVHISELTCQIFMFNFRCINAA